MTDAEVEQDAPAKAPAASAPAAAAPIDPAPVDDVEAKWKSVLIVASGPIPTGEKRAVIVCQSHDDDGKLLSATYPKGADLYYGYVGDDESADQGDFGKNSPIVRLGAELQQGRTRGLSIIPGIVNVGPGSPAYGALNVATLRGATDVEIRGLSDAQKAQLAPWIAGIPTDPETPSDVKVTLS